VPVEDSGGPLTLRALTDGTVQVADLYTADPAIAKNGFVDLEDPEEPDPAAERPAAVCRTKVDGRRGRHRGGQRQALGGRSAGSSTPAASTSRRSRPTSRPPG
jgi:hypothetical protein